MYKVFLKLSSLIPALALVFAASSANATCHFFLHQPDVPAGLKKYEK